MNPVVLITRPQAESENFANAARALGYDPLIAPLLSVEYLPADLGEPDPDAIVATSPHAFPHTFHAAAPASWKALPVFVMGETSLQRAQANGYADVISSGGHFQVLIEAIERKLAPGSRILYLRGEHIRHDLKSRLERYRVSEKTVYAMREKTVLPDRIAQALKSGRVQVITFFSARTAAIFRDLAEAQGLRVFMKDIKALCLSPAVLDSIRSLPWKETAIAPRPDRSGMLAGLQTWIGNFHE